MYALIRQFCIYEDDNKEYELGAILLNKLPRHIRSKIYDRTSTRVNLTPSALIHLLTDIVRKESTLQEMEPQDLNCRNRHVLHAVSKTNRQQQAIPLKTTHNTPTTAKCPFCRQTGHNSFTCPTYSTPNRRLVKKNGLCYNCLSRVHRTKDCLSTRTCSHCSKWHHTSLCFKHANSTGTSLSASPLHPEPRRTLSSRPLLDNQHTTLSQQSRARPPRQENIQTHFSEHFNKESSTPAISAQPTITLHGLQHQQHLVKSLLVCVEVQLFNPLDDSKEVRATALLDTGASQSYITNDLA